MILQSKRVWILNEWMEVQVEFSAETGKITGILPYGAKPADLDDGDQFVYYKSGPPDRTGEKEGVCSGGEGRRSCGLKR